MNYYEKQNESSLFEISKCLIEFQVPPKLAAEESQLLTSISKLNYQQHKWIVESSDLINHIEAEIRNALQLVDSATDSFKEKSAVLKEEVLNLKKQSIELRHKHSTIELENVHLQKKIGTKEATKSFENYQKCPLDEINTLFSQITELDSKIQTAESGLRLYDGIPADINLAKVELAKCDSVLVLDVFFNFVGGIDQPKRRFAI